MTSLHQETHTVMTETGEMMTMMRAMMTTAMRTEQARAKWKCLSMEAIAMEVTLTASLNPRIGDDDKICVDVCETFVSIMDYYFNFIKSFWLN